MIVRSDAGLEGYASGDALPDAALLERLLVGLDPLRPEVVREVCETVDFHGGRPWTAEVATWDLAGRALGEPLWRLLGGRSERLLAYASSGEPVDAGERARRVAALSERGVRAVKLRFHHRDWRRDVELVERVRDAVGADVELMVDANQGWRMPGDREDRWDVATASQCARALEPLGVYWLEEPLRTDDVDGYATLRRRTSLRIAAGELVRGAFEARDLIVRGGVDVVQPDAVLAGGIGRLPADRRAGGSLRPRVHAPHLVERDGTPRKPPSRARGVDLSLRGGSVGPSRLDAGASRLAAARSARDRGRRLDRPTSRPRPGRHARPRRARGVPRRVSGSLDRPPTG